MFALRLRDIMAWVDADTTGTLDAAALRDGFRERILRLTRDFLAYPQCENFGLMPGEHEEIASSSGSTTASNTTVRDDRGGAGVGGAKKKKKTNSGAVVVTAMDTCEDDGVV
jgi:hypothetical protein